MLYLAGGSASRSSVVFGFSGRKEDEPVSEGRDRPSKLPPAAGLFGERGRSDGVPFATSPPRLPDRKRP